MSTSTVTEEDVLGYFESLSNWGRWGEDDQLGTINLITNEKRVEAAQLIREGIALSLALPMDANIPMKQPVNGMLPLIHHMIVSGESWKNVAQQPNMWQGAADYVAFTIHGHQFTHLDAFAHAFWNGKGYNGLDAGEVTTYDGATRGGIEHFRTSIDSRGVLLDLTKVRDTSARTSGREVITLDDVLRAQEITGIDVRSGDILLHRTGVAVQGNVGFHPDILPWLHEHGVAVFGGDTAQDIMPPVFENVNHPIHQVGITAMGMPMIDNVVVDELARTCDELQRWDFHLSVTPLPIYRATGLPVNPIATF